MAAKHNTTQHNPTQPNPMLSNKTQEHDKTHAKTQKRHHATHLFFEKKITLLGP